ncbi:MAG: hypothetical protein JNN30_14805 [Rhodanobacteraceae bacterium]|nr:hypothetical protein [Rhodanobacteraceae bacterium]
MRIGILGFLGFFCFFAVAVQAAPLRVGVSSTDLATGTFGDNNGGGQFQVQLYNFSGVTAVQPLTMKLNMPAGFELRNFVSVTGSWNCTGGSTANPELTCINSQNIANGSSAAVRIFLNIASNAPAGPGSTTVTAESTQFPLPAPPGCVTTASGNAVDSQCVTRTFQVVQSALTVVDITAVDAPLTTGTQEQVLLRINNTGYSGLNRPWHLDIYWPTGLSFVQLDSTLPSWSCSAAGTNPTICTSNSTIIGTVATTFRVQVAANIAVPGPVRIVASTGNNNSQPAPADCLTNLMQQGCGFGDLATSVPLVTNLAITSMVITPAIFPIGNNAGQVRVNYENLGNGGASNFNLRFDLPPGFSYASTAAASTSASCSRSGSVVNGELVHCVMGTVGPAPASGNLTVTVSISPSQMVRGGPTPEVLASIDSVSGTQSLNVLLSCANNPAQPFCGLVAVPLIGECMDYAEDIFCYDHEL